MARPAQVVEDSTPLTGARVDVARRAGWLLRFARLLRHVSQEELARRLREAGIRASASRLSQLETGGVRSGLLSAGYEQALGLEHGRLRAAIDAMSRTNGEPPVDQAPGSTTPTDLAGFDAAVDPVLTGDATAADWLRFALAHQGGSGFGLPSDLMRPMVDRLLSEMGRSVGTAHVVRYEALTRLRCGPYADLVEAAVRDLVADPDTQVLYEAVSLVAELPTPRVLAWAGELLGHDSDRVAHGAMLAVENLRSVGGLPVAAWQRLVPDFLAAYRRADRGRRTELTELYKNLPAPVRRAVLAGLDAPLQPVRAPVDWTASRRNRHYAIASDLACKVCSDAAVPDQPMLARLLFEVLYDFRRPRVATSSFLLTAAPLEGLLLPRLLALVADGPDQATREGAAGAVTLVQSATETPDVLPWLASDDRRLVRCGLTAAAHGGVTVPEETLRALLRDPGLRRHALYAAGMTAHPLLVTLSTDASVTSDVRAAAAWWLRSGGRVPA